MAAKAFPRMMLSNSVRGSWRGWVRSFANESSATSIREGFLPLTFASAAKAYYQGAEVKQVDVPSVQGSFGILPKHVPAIAALKPGVLTVYEEAEMKKYFVSSGAVTINEDSTVQIMAEEAFPLADIDVTAARTGLEKAQSQLSSAGTERAKAEAGIAVEFYEALVKAVE